MGFRNIQEKLEKTIFHSGPIFNYEIHSGSEIDKLIILQDCNLHSKFDTAKKCHLQM